MSGKGAQSAVNVGSRASGEEPPRNIATRGRDVVIATWTEFFWSGKGEPVSAEMLN
jgi:hypothetical protein